MGDHTQLANDTRVLMAACPLTPPTNQPFANPQWRCVSGKYLEYLIFVRLKGMELHLQVAKVPKGNRLRSRVGSQITPLQK